MKLTLGIWEIAVLGTLREAPMHPYQMQRLLRHRHKDEILALKRGSLYHAIGRLAAQGRDEFLAALRSIVSTPRRESSEFMAAMSFLVHLTPYEALPHLDERCSLLAEEIERQRTVLREAGRFVEKINLIENEYLLAMLKAEREWVLRLAAEVREGKLTWNLERLYAQIKSDTEAAGRQPS
jgi:hypothetical protein